MIGLSVKFEIREPLVVFCVLKNEMDFEKKNEDIYILDTRGKLFIFEGEENAPVLNDTITTQRPLHLRTQSQP